MSQENVEISLAFVALYNARDLPGAVALCTEDVAVSPDRSAFLEAEPFSGREAYRRFLQETWEAWGDATVIVREAVAAPGERVLVRTDWEAKGAESGLEVSTNLSAVYTFHSGHIAAADYFFDHSDALRAVGLEEQGMSQENVEAGDGARQLHRPRRDPEADR